MSRVRNREELLDEIGLLVDEYIEYILKKRKRKKLKKAEVEVPKPDPVCRAMLKSKKRCSRDKKGDEATADEDPDFCKLHNNPKFKGKLEKVPLPTPTVKTVVENEDNGSSNSESSEDGEELIEVNITVDSKGNKVDQHGNVWDMENRIIIGKKDPKTKEVIIHKRI